MPLTFISYYIYTTSTNDKDEKQMARKNDVFLLKQRKVCYFYIVRGTKIRTYNINK